LAEAGRLAAARLPAEGIARLKASGEGVVLAWFKQKPRYQKEINRTLWKVMREEGRESLE
jgi:hypothetical protein